MTLRTAVIGAGTVSSDHLRALARNPLTEPVAVCDIDEGRARKLASEHGTAAYTELEDLLRTDLDWVHVCTPVQTHLEIALDVIDAEIPVLIEKPITVTSSEFEELQEAAETNDVPVSPVHNWLFFPVMRRLRAAVRQGHIGAITGVDVLFNGMTKPDEANRGSWVFELAGGEFEEALPHPIYITLAMGGYPRDGRPVQAITSLRGTYDVDVAYDGAQVQYVGKNGAINGVRMLSGERTHRAVQVYGTEGVAVADLISGSVSVTNENYLRSPVHRAKKDVDAAVDHLQNAANAPFEIAQMFQEYKLGRHSDQSVSGHYALIDQTAKALEHGDALPVPLEQAGQTIEIMEQIRTASRENEGTTPAVT